MLQAYLLAKVPVASRLAELAKRFHATCGQAAQQAGEIAKKDGTNPSQLQPRLRRAGLKYYADCESSRCTPRSRGSWRATQTQGWVSSSLGLRLDLGCLKSEAPSMTQGVYATASGQLQAAAECWFRHSLAGCTLASDNIRTCTLPRRVIATGVAAAASDARCGCRDQQQHCNVPDAGVRAGGLHRVQEGPAVGRGLGARAGSGQADGRGRPPDQALVHGGAELLAWPQPRGQVGSPALHIDTVGLDMQTVPATRILLSLTVVGARLCGKSMYAFPCWMC